jgi:hypothetical protein
MCIVVAAHASRFAPAVDHHPMDRRSSLLLAHTRVAVLVVAFSSAAACGRMPLGQVDAAGGGGGSAGAGGPMDAGGDAGGAGAGGQAGSAPGGPGTCATGAGGRGGSIWTTECNDGRDNDGDGHVDYDDPECIGGYDNNETSFGWGIPDDVDDCTTDCFFDGNSGSGDDGCRWRLKCEPASVTPGCPYDAAYAEAHPEECSLSAAPPLTQACVDRCGKLVPNGCDCFGCCAIAGLPGPVRLAQACTTADFGDPQKCPPCSQVTWCLNPCERCELCIGKPVLADDCSAADGGTPYACPAGAIACGAHGVAPMCCPAATSCVTGCCLPLDPSLP